MPDHDLALFDSQLAKRAELTEELIVATALSVAENEELIRRTRELIDESRRVIAHVNEQLTMVRFPPHAAD